MPDLVPKVETFRFDLPSGAEATVIHRQIRVPFAFRFVSALFVPVVDVTAPGAVGRSVNVFADFPNSAGNPALHATYAARATYNNGGLASAFVGNQLPVVSSGHLFPAGSVLMACSRGIGSGTVFPGGTVFVDMILA